MLLGGEAKSHTISEHEWGPMHIVPNSYGWPCMGYVWQLSARDVHSRQTLVAVTTVPAVLRARQVDRHPPVVAKAITPQVVNPRRVEAAARAVDCNVLVTASWLCC
jgi:hypothetical protein